MENPSTSALARGERRLRLFRLAAVALGTVAGLLLLEIGLRVREGKLLESGNFIMGDIGEGVWVPHPLLGQMPRPLGVWAHEGIPWKFTFGEHSIRLNGNDLPDTAKPWLVATGDSYTFGAYMHDVDSWPSALERLAGKRVINGGVDGFGFDQAVLRAIELNKIYDPEIVVVSFIPHDVVPRCEMSNMFNRPKPYFELDGNGLRYVPPLVAERPRPSWIHKIGGYSLLLHTLLNDYAGQYWHCHIGPEKQEHQNGREVGCRLMAKLAADPVGVKTVIFAQHRPAPSDEDLDITRQMLDCARANHLRTFDLRPALLRFTDAERAQMFNEPRDRHMSIKGNLLAAAELKAFLDTHTAER